MKRSIFHPKHINKHVQRARMHFSTWKKKKKNIYVLLMVVAIVLIRRGIWGLLDMYVLPNHPTWSMIVSVLIGLLILYLDDKNMGELME